MLKATIIRLVYIGTLFLASLVISNIALPGKFGILSLLVLNASLFLILTGFGVDSVALFKLSNNQWSILQAYRFVWRGFLLQATIFGVLELGTLLIFHKTLLSNASPDYFLIDASYFLGLALVDKYIALYYSQDRSATANTILASIGFVYLLLLLLCYYVIKVDWVFILYLFGFQNVAQAITLIIFFRQVGMDKSNLRKEKLSSTFKLSTIVVVTNIIQLLAYRLDFWLINYFYGNYEVGIYAQANKLANFSWILPNVLSQILIPSFAGMNKKSASEIFSTTLVSNFFIILLTLAFGQFFYFFYLNPQYRAGLDAFYLMLPGYFFWGSVIYFGNFFASKGKFVYNLAASSLCFILIFVADISLIPVYGIKGAALANSITYFSVFVLYIFILTKKRSFDVNALLLPHKRSFLNLYKMVSK